MAKEEESSCSKKSTTPAVTNWNLPRVIAARLEVPEWASNNVVKLIDEGCTVPFIARYRREQTGNMDIQKLRDVCTLVEELRTLQGKISSVKSTIEKIGKMTTALEQALKSAQSMTEVEDLFAPYKPGNKGTLAERARALGLEVLANKYLKGDRNIDLETYINPEEKGLSTRKKVKEGVTHILADIVHKDTGTMEKIRDLCNDRSIMLESTLSKTKKKKVLKPGEKDPERERHKFEDYHEKKFPVHCLKPHVVLALNRGEDLKILSLKVILGSYVKRTLIQFCEHKWIKQWMDSHCQEMIRASIEDAYERMMMPQMTRIIRNQLTKAAEKSSIEVFASNLKCLLLASPLRGKTILALDPGFSNGCKSAVVSPTGQVLETEVLYINDKRANQMVERSKMLKMIAKHRCDIFAVGNGVACRETETYVSEIIKTEYPNMKYCIVDESGASIYSVSDMAVKELSELDVPLRGAVSIGRRLLDPLAELVKIDPKHLGVGQYQKREILSPLYGRAELCIYEQWVELNWRSSYGHTFPQHDMPQTQMKTTLDSIVEECVSFVGADINTSSECLLSRIAGLSAARAKKIIEWREKNGPFKCREQLMCVKGLGEKSYEQAAGFIRVYHSTADQKGSIKSEIKEETVADTTQKPGTKRKTATKKVPAKKRKVEDFHPNRLDMTWIHPESYTVAETLMERIGVQVDDLGQPYFIQQVENFMKKNSLPELSSLLDCGEPTLKLITDALIKPLSYDFREESQKPFFRSSVSSIVDLTRGERLTGKVMNVTHFGAFVDIGVGDKGLIHVSKMPRQCLNGKTMLEVGDKVQVSVENVDISRGRIGLILERLF